MTTDWVCSTGQCWRWNNAVSIGGRKFIKSHTNETAVSRLHNENNRDFPRSSITVIQKEKIPFSFGCFVINRLFTDAVIQHDIGMLTIARISFACFFFLLSGLFAAAAAVFIRLLIKRSPCFCLHTHGRPVLLRRQCPFNNAPASEWFLMRIPFSCQNYLFTFNSFIFQWLIMIMVGYMFR